MIQRIWTWFKELSNAQTFVLVSFVIALSFLLAVLLFFAPYFLWLIPIGLPVAVGLIADDFQTDTLWFSLGAVSSIILLLLWICNAVIVYNQLFSGGY